MIIRNLTAALADPAVAYSATSDRYLVTFNSGDDLAGAVVNGAVTSLVATPTISSLTGTQDKSRVAWNSADDEWGVVFESDHLGDDDVFLRRVSNGGSLLGSLVSVAISVEDEQDPTVSYLPSSSTYLVGYDRFSTTGSDWNVWAREHKADGTAVAANFQASSSPTAGSDEFLTAIAANTLQGEWLQVWQDDRDGFDYDVYGQRFSSDTTPPRVVRFDPQDTATGVFLDKVFVQFSQDMDDTTITSANLKVYQAGVTEITSTTVTYLSATRQGRITVAGDWPTTQSLKVSVGTGTKNSLNVALLSVTEATFLTGISRSLDDSDGDGLLDIEEVLLGLDPFDADSDGDGLTDWEELFVYFTDPLNPDTDGDGTPTAATRRRTDARRSTVVPDPDPTASFKITQFHPRGTFGSPANVTSTPTLAVTFNNPVDVGTISLGTNIYLEDQTTFSLVTLSLEPQPNPRTVVVKPTSTLVNGRLYLLTVIDGSGSIKDTLGQTLGALDDSVIRVSTPTSEGFEATHYLNTLRRTQWEVFPLTAPTAGGRAGAALVVPSTRKLLLTETDVVTPGRGIPVELTRTYRNNDDAASGIFGNNWHFTYDRGFEVIADVNGDGRRDLRFRTADGRLFTYLSGATTQAKDYTSPPGFFETQKTVTMSGQKHLGHARRLRERALLPLPPAQRHDRRGP
ncbi:MAG: Ig-like domain-containing protein [Planctomycetes bacterium]|nr:Ig-like domain-containing protein [Planctomycetota bacterium]